MLHEVIQYLWVVINILEYFFGLVAYKYLEELAEISS
jgi:hypothetical protein